MKTALLLLLAAFPAAACDWAIVSDKVDPMTDQRVCMVMSPSAHLGVAARGDSVSFASSSRYRYDYLTIRVDDNEPIMLNDRNNNTRAYDSDARDLLAQIKAGKRIRVQYRDVDGQVNGDAQICDLPALIVSCQSP